MDFIDTHAHLDFEYEKDVTVESIIKEAKENNVSRIITISSDPSSLEKAHKIANSYENVFYSLGIHPHEAKDFSLAIEKQIYDLKDDKCVAIGEIGLDYHYDHSPHDIQKKTFVRFIEIAQELKLPIIVHSRNADNDIYEIIKSEYKDYCPGLIHCYSGTKKQLGKYLDLNMHVSFTGIVSFPKAGDVKEAAAYAPDNRVMLETDSPFLAPNPKRGRTNYPKYIPYIAQAIADIKDQTIEQVAEYTTNNAVSFFGL